VKQLYRGFWDGEIFRQQVDQYLVGFSCNRCSVYRDLIFLLRDFDDVFFPSLRFYLNGNPKGHASTIRELAQDQNQSLAATSASQKAMIGQPESDRLSHKVEITTRGGKA
jgi:hypothetical protein